MRLFSGLNKKEGPESEVLKASFEGVSFCFCQMVLERKQVFGKTMSGHQCVEASRDGDPVKVNTLVPTQGDSLSQGLHHLTDPVSVQDQNFGKQTQEIGIQAEQCKKDYEQK